jgi:hypothetical protein
MLLCSTTIATQFMSTVVSLNQHDMRIIIHKEDKQRYVHMHEWTGLARDPTFNLLKGKQKGVFLRGSAGRLDTSALPNRALSTAAPAREARAAATPVREQCAPRPSCQEGCPPRRPGRVTWSD